MFFENLFSIVFMWSFHVRFSSKSTPENFTLAFLFSSTPSILGIGGARGRLSFWVLLWYALKALTFFVLSNNLFPSNHSFIFCNSKLALVKRGLITLSEINRSVLSPKIVPSKPLETRLRSIMYKINSYAPKKDPWGRLHIIFWNDVFPLLLLQHFVYDLRKAIYSYSVNLSFSLKNFVIYCVKYFW